MKNTGTLLRIKDSSWYLVLVHYCRWFMRHPLNAGFVDEPMCGIFMFCNYRISLAYNASMVVPAVAVKALP